jgi:hypothetical protein
MTTTRSATQRRIVHTEISRVCFAVGITGVLTAGVGAMIDHLLTGWMSVMGMIGVSLFYIALGFANLRFELSPAAEPSDGDRWDDDLAEELQEPARSASSSTARHPDNHGRRTQKTCDPIGTA